MNLEQMKLAVCEELDFVWLNQDEHPVKGRPIINWPTEGLQVCLEASVLMNLPFRIEHAFRSWSVTIWLGQTDERKVVVENKDLLTAWLEALCRVWWPERSDVLLNEFTDYAEYANSGVVYRMVRVKDLDKYLDDTTIKPEWTLDPSAR